MRWSIDTVELYAVTGESTNILPGSFTTIGGSLWHKLTMQTAGRTPGAGG